MVIAGLIVGAFAVFGFIMGILTLRHVHEMERGAVLVRKKWTLADYEVSVRKYFIGSSVLLVVAVVLLFLA